MSWLVALEDGASYSANAYTSDETIGDFTLGAETPRLFLGVVETCSHGSPFVPRLGFVCGRC